MKNNQYSNAQSHGLRNKKYGDQRRLKKPKSEHELRRFKHLKALDETRKYDRYGDDVLGKASQYGPYRFLLTNTLDKSINARELVSVCVKDFHEAIYSNTTQVDAADTRGAAITGRMADDSYEVFIGFKSYDDFELYQNKVDKDFLADVFNRSSKDYLENKGLEYTEWQVVQENHAYICASLLIAEDTYGRVFPIVLEGI